jgi:hypothetical protein
VHLILTFFPVVFFHDLGTFEIAVPCLTGKNSFGSASDHGSISRRKPTFSYLLLNIMLLLALVDLDMRLSGTNSHLSVLQILPA